MAEWFEGLEADHQAELEAKGWKAPLTPEIAVAVAQAHRAATKMLGVPADQVLRLPKDASDPTYQAAYDRIVSMSVPKDAEGYVLDGIKFKDGSALSAEDVSFVRDLAVKYKLPATAAHGIAAELAARSDAFEAADVERSNLGRQANDTALRTTWATDYNQKAFAASQASDALKALGMHVSDGAGMAPEDYVKHMNALVAMSAQLNEAAVLRGGGSVADPTNGMSPEMARTRFNELMTNPTWVENALKAGTPEADLLGKLQRAMVTAPR